MPRVDAPTRSRRPCDAHPRCPGAGVLAAPGWRVIPTGGSIRGVGFVERLDQLSGATRPRAEKLREAMAMYDEGIALQRQTLRRRHPQASPEELEQKLLAWLLREESG